MVKKRHHYVPQFYLGAFSNNGKQLNLYNLKRRQAVQNATLRDQCCEPHLHGDTDEYEDAIANVEDHFAPVVKEIVRTSTLPKAGSGEHGLLYFFVATQMIRTTRAAEKLNSGIDKITKQAYRDDPTLEGEDLDAIRIGFGNPVVYSLQTLSAAAMEGISDLGMCLICATGEQTFVTSDNPVFKYNHYLEGIRGYGLTGTLARGLQIFVPLSPTHLLMLYDRTVYDIGLSRYEAILHKVPNADISKLNAFQVQNASENLYFKDWARLPYIEHLVKRFSKYRITDPMQVEEFIDTEDENQSLLHYYERVPNFGLHLSFTRVWDEAAKFSKHEQLRDENKLRRDPSRMQTAPPTPPRSPGMEGRERIVFARPVTKAKKPNKKNRK